MQHSAHLFGPLLSHDPQRVFLGIPGVDDERFVQCPGYPDMFAERGLLYILVFR